MPGLDDAIKEIKDLREWDTEQEKIKEKLIKLSKEKDKVLLISFVNYLAELQGNRTVFQSALALMTAYKEIDNFLDERNK